MDQFSIEIEPGDAMSRFPFLTYSNQWDAEGLVATASAVYTFLVIIKGGSIDELRN